MSPKRGAAPQAAATAQAKEAEGKAGNSATSLAQPGVAQAKTVAGQAGNPATSHDQPVAPQAGLTANPKAGLTANPKAPLARPLKPAQADIDAGVASSVSDYMKELVPYVQERLLALLKTTGAFEWTLAEAPPLQISSDAQKAFKNFKEPWNMQNCLAALTSTQLYEASGNIFWLDILGTRFGEHVLSDAEVTWRQLEEGMSLWGEDAFISSCDDVRYRRYMFQLTYPPRWQICLTLKQ